MDPQLLRDAAFWKQDLGDRMLGFAELQAQGPFHDVTFEDPFLGTEGTFTAVLGYDEVVDISRRPTDFCSGLGATSVIDMQEDARDFFGSFINQ